jgi:hypothetical protein
MIVDSVSLANELRRRRAGRASLRRSLLDGDKSTWLPGDVRDLPTALLVLAAMSMARESEVSMARDSEVSTRDGEVPRS